MVSFLKKIAKPFVLSVVITLMSITGFQKLYADIIVVNSEKFITLGSTKDEVLEVLGTPTRMTDKTWYYGSYLPDYLEFKENRVSYFSDSNRLKIKILPNRNNLNYVDLSNQKDLTNSNYFSDLSSHDRSSKSSGQSTAVSKSTKSKISVPSSSLASGYGEISKLTGRPKTVHVNGYYRKDGTYVKPHYRSPPRR